MGSTSQKDLNYDPIQMMRERDAKEASNNSSNLEEIPEAKRRNKNQVNVSELNRRNPTKYGSGQDVPDVKIESAKPRPSYDPLAMLKNRTTENDEDKSRADEGDDQPLGKQDLGQSQDGLVTFHTDEEPGARVARQSRVYHSSSEDEEVEEKVRGKKLKNEEGKGKS